MKLLFDQNLSRRLAAALQDLFPGSVHVQQIELATADDSTVWNYAAEHDFAIISKDSDFRQMSFLFGAPPKVIWLRVGNCPTQEIEQIIRAHHADIINFGQSREGTFLVLT